MSLYLKCLHDHCTPFDQTNLSGIDWVLFIFQSRIAIPIPGPQYCISIYKTARLVHPCFLGLLWFFEQPVWKKLCCCHQSTYVEPRFNKFLTQRVSQKCFYVSKWIQKSFLKNKASFWCVKSISYNRFQKLVYDMSKNVMSTVIFPVKLQPQRIKTVAMRAKIVWPVKIHFPHPIFYIDQKQVKLDNFLETLWVWILLKRGSA